MKLYAPKYYKDFVCIADKCTHSCCIGWEIDIDAETMNKYSLLECDYAEAIINSIESVDTPHFKLGQNDRCPHLDEKGLCKIIKNVGDNYLCDICREHPKFYNFTNRGKEIGIGISCEESCRLILSSDEYDEIVEIGDICGDNDVYEFDATKHRERVYKILKDNSLSYDGKLEMIYDYYDIYLDNVLCRDTFDSLEYLDHEHRILFTEISDYHNWQHKDEPKLVRALAYFIYRHCSEACDFDEFCISLSFSILLTHLIASISNEENVDDIARIVSEEIEYSEDNTERLKSLFY